MLKTAIDPKDLKIREMTRSIRDLLQAMKRDPAWYRCSLEASEAIFDAFNALHVGMSHTHQAGLTLAESDDEPRQLEPAPVERYAG